MVYVISGKDCGLAKSGRVSEAFFRTFSRSFSVTALGFTHSHIVQKSSFFGKDKAGDRVSEAFFSRNSAEFFKNRGILKIEN